MTIVAAGRLTRRGFAGSMLAAGASIAMSQAVLAQSDDDAGARFAIVIDGFEITSFSELVGIVSEPVPVAYLESNDREVYYNQLPGKLKPPMVALKHGKNGSMQLWAWHEAVRKGTMEAARRSCSLVIHNAEGRPIVKYRLVKAWPAKLEISAMQAGTSQVTYATVTFACEHMQRVAV